MEPELPEVKKVATPSKISLRSIRKNLNFIGLTTWGTEGELIHEIVYEVPPPAWRVFKNDYVARSINRAPEMASRRLAVFTGYCSGEGTSRRPTQLAALVRAPPEDQLNRPL